MRRPSHALSAAQECVAVLLAYFEIARMQQQLPESKKMLAVRQQELDLVRVQREVRRDAAQGSARPLGEAQDLYRCYS